MDKYIVGNWKMNQGLKEIETFFKDLSQHCPSEGVHTWIAPQTLHLSHCLQNAPDFIQIGAQNCSEKLSGAFTGESSAQSLKELGTSFTLVGHSERRAIFKEDLELIKEKTITAIKEGLKVILCVGETLKQRENKQTLGIIKEQLQFLEELGYNSQLLIAYEPVWAIGTGLSATPEQAQEVHAFIREYLTGIWNADSSAKTPLLYGGSVKPENVESLMMQSDINGALVGGASLLAEKYLKLYQN